MTHVPPLIALVEDESSVRRALRRLLASAGLSVETYASGEEFLAALPDHAPDCLLLDVQLPGLDGVAVQSSLQHSGFRLPIIFITATERPAARERALRNGARAWLRKPLDEQVLLVAIEHALPRAESS